MLYCPKCGGNAYGRSGVHFDHEWLCSGCSHAFEPEQAMPVATKLASVQGQLKAIQEKGQKLIKKWKKSDDETKAKCAAALKRILG